MLSSLLAIQWDPDVTGYLAVIIGVIVLCGSVYLLLATNVGTRLGFLIAFCGLTGWIFLMAIIWWVYGIGLVGESPSWEPLQVTTSLASSTIDEVRDLDSVEIGAGAPAEWSVVDESATGDIYAAADAEIVCPPGDARLLEVVSNCLFGSAQAIEHHRAFEAGGERFRPLGIPENVVTDFFIPSRGRPHYAVVQVQEFAEADAVGLNSSDAIPDPVIDPNAPIWSVVMVRDQGSLRLPPFLITLGSGLLFALTAYQLHRRDLAIMAMQQKSR